MKLVESPCIGSDQKLIHSESVLSTNSSMNPLHFQSTFHKGGFNGSCISSIIEEVDESR